MITLFQNFVEILPFFFWAVFWGLGGIWLVRAVFNLHPREQAITGITIGLAIQTLLANMISWIAPAPLSFWLAAIVVFIVGLILGYKKGPSTLVQIPVFPGQWVMIFFLVYLFTGIGRGLAILDDFAHLPTLSLLAAGEIPPRFALDPSIPYGYHYFLILFAAQVMRIADVFPWTAMDIARGISFGLSVTLAGIWSQRLTRSLWGGVYASAMHMFAMGTRWILLLLPAGVLGILSREITLTGGSADWYENLESALVGVWPIEGAGPIPFPFAFVNSVLTPGVMQHASNGMIQFAITLAILLTFNRWKGWTGAAVMVLLIACSGLLGEVGLVLEIAGLGLVLFATILQQKRFFLPESLRIWTLIFIAGWVLAMVQGGTITQALRGLFAPTLLREEFVSYQTVNFIFAWPPTIVTGHLGSLSMFNFWQLLVGLLEIGPVILVLPLALAWGMKSFRAGRWFEAVIMASAAISILLFFVQYSGSSGVRNTTRLYAFIRTCWFWAAPLAWIWVSHRPAFAKILVIGLSAISMFGGVILLGVQLPAMQQPVYTYFIDELDAQIEKRYWNQLEKDAIIFDPTPSRAPVVFGRPTDSSISWWTRKDTWQELYNHPDPEELNRAGFSYAYLDSAYLNALPALYQDLLSGDCVVVVDRIQSRMGSQSRSLLDIQACK